MNEAENRHSSFTENIMGAPVEVLKWEYAWRTRAWRDAVFNGFQWGGVPGARGLALGESRNALLGGGFKTGAGAFNRFGINKINPLFSGLKPNIKQYGLFGNSNNFLSQYAGKFFGGTQTNLLRVADIPEASRPAVTKTLNTNWFKSLFSEKIATNRFVGQEAMLPFSQAPGLQRIVPVTKLLGGRAAAWKFAIATKFIPGAIWATNLAFVASLTAPIFSAVGQVISGGLGMSDQMRRLINNRQVDFGGKIHSTYMNGPGMTERQRALGELQRSRTNARSFISNEASLYHM